MAVAASMRERIFDTFETKDYLSEEDMSDILNFNDALYPDNEFIALSRHPQQRTLLHIYIERYLDAEWNYGRRKLDDFFVDEVGPRLELFNIKFQDSSSFVGDQDDYNQYLYGKIQETIPETARQAFELMFADRMLMRAFSTKVSKIILSENLKIERCSFPKWLKDALFNREKGRCTLCGSDLTQLLAVDNAPQIDHIVPISIGGTNDPTNLQLICAACNRKKSNKNSQSSDLHHVLWCHEPDSL